MRGRLFTFALLAMTQLAAPAKAEIRALVIGIDSYDHIPSLDGAVNDARDLAETLHALGAEVTLLLDREASRERIMEEWRRNAEATDSDDLFFISYAGHGSNEPEFWPDNEFDGRDETLLLSGFAPSGADAAARIRDDEIADLLALSPRENTILIADACHAGTLSRSVRPVLGYRYYAHGKIVDDPLPPPPAKTPKNEGRGDLGMFLAAVDETAKVPEFLIDGEPRGALSYAMAKALRGEADSDGDKALTVGEIETYVRRTIRNISHGLQRPQISRLSDNTRVLVSLENRSGNETSASPDPAREDPRSVWETAFDDLPEVTVAPGPRAQSSLGSPRSATAPDVSIESDGTIRSGIGDVLGIAADAETRQRILDKVRMINHLSSLQGASLLDVYFTAGDKTYREGETIEVSVTGRESAYITLFNIAADGEVSLLYPYPAFDDPESIDPGQDLRLPLGVQPPVGADHVFAIETASAPQALRAIVAAADGSRDTRAFWEDLRAIMGTEADTARVAIFPFFTVGEP